MSGKPKKVKLPKRTPVVRKRKRGVAKRPPPKKVASKAASRRYGEEHKAKTKATKSRRSKLLALRYAAEIRYTTDPAGITLRELSKQEPFTDNVSHNTLKTWYAGEGWKKKRAEYFQNISDSIEKNLGKRLVDTQIEQLRRVDALFEKALDRAESSEPKSMEGMIGAVVNLLRIGNELREKIVKEIVPAQLGGADEGMQVTPKLTEEEARAAAIAIIRTRRTNVRQKVLDDRDDGEEEKPQLRLVGQLPSHKGGGSE